ncbi:MAG: metallophosphoesterase family protein [Clostridia bacterium]|nr:metallophosphoesterase family protein [Clostridia bacterium]
MQIALIADLHGNRPAVEALEKDLQFIQPDKIYCLGDIVGKGPSSDYTFDWAMANCDLILGGNWDYGVGYKQFPFDKYYWDQLGEERLKKLRELPREHHMYMSGRHIRLFHGRPVMDTLVTVRYPADQIEPFFDDGCGNRFDAVIYADAHSQAMRTISPGIFVNTGSVGNGIGVPKCCYAILCGEEGKTPAPMEIRMRQLEYDREQAVRDAEAAPDVPRIDTFIREIQTGIYSRR